MTINRSDIHPDNCQHEWRPIDSAPKDGTRILLARNDRVWLDDWWEGDTKSGWASVVAWEQAGGSYSLPPTHWMPLPDPPKEQP